MTLPFWNSLETAKSIHLWSQGLAILFFAFLVGFEAVAHWNKRKRIAKCFGTLAICAFAVAVAFETLDFVYSRRWENLQEERADAKIKAAEKRAQDAEDTVKNFPKPIVLAPLSRTNFKLSERWGNKAKVSNVSGDALAFAFTITSRGDGTAMQPTVEISYPDSASRTAHAKLCIQTGGSGSVTDIRWEVSREKMTATYLGLVLVGKTYTIACN